jgi:hypothetical protein
MFDPETDSPEAEGVAVDDTREETAGTDGSGAADTGVCGQAEVRLSPIGRLFRFIGWWFGFTGLYATFTVCPFCGQPGCPVGMASAGAVGAFLALCMQDWRRFLGFRRGKLARGRKG